MAGHWLMIASFPESWAKVPRRVSRRDGGYGGGTYIYIHTIWEWCGIHFAWQEVYFHFCWHVQSRVGFQANHKTDSDTRRCGGGGGGDDGSSVLLFLLSSSPRTSRRYQWPGVVLVPCESGSKRVFPRASLCSFGDVDVGIRPGGSVLGSGRRMAVGVTPSLRDGRCFPSVVCTCTNQTRELVVLQTC